MQQLFAQLELLERQRLAKGGLKYKLHWPITALKYLWSQLFMSVLHLSAVYSNPGILSGQPVFRGTRVTFQTLLDHLEDGGGNSGFEEFLQGFPTVSRQLALVALEENHKLYLLK
jgi:uncharacterized protein (DUF433 family)